MGRLVPPILTFIISELAANFIVLWRKSSDPFSWIPELEKSSGLSQKIMDAKHNFCAVSSKDPALWRSPTFMSYLMDNATKTLAEMSKLYQVPFILSRENEDKEAYIRECREALRVIGNNEDPEGFVGIRLMIYDSDVLKSEEKLLTQMVSLHAKGGMFCIPVQKGILVQNLHPDDKQLISNWQVSLGTTQAKEGMTTIPDVLLIDNHSKSEDLADSMWWFDEGVWKSGQYPSEFATAKKGFAMLCKKVFDSNAISADFTPSLIEAVAIPDRIALVKKFFSLPYFLKFLQQAPEEFQRWFSKEEEFISSLGKANPNSCILDVGCGQGRHMALLARNGVYVTGIDNNPVMIENATLKLKFDPTIARFVDLYLENVQRMHFENESFDFVVCMTNTFGNMPGIEEKVLREMTRVLKPNGKIILSVYCDDQYYMGKREKTYKDIQMHVKHRNVKSIETREGLYSRHFSKKDLEHYCSSVGLIPEVQTFTDLAFLCVAHKRELKH